MYHSRGHAAPGIVEPDRVRLGVVTSELWTDWCALQTPVNPGDTNCLPNTSGSIIDYDTCHYDAPSGEVEVDCGKFFLCMTSNVCICDPVTSECTYQDLGRTSFDFHVDGDNGDGTVGVGSGYNVHLTR